MRAETRNQGGEDREPVAGKEGKECALRWDTLDKESAIELYTAGLGTVHSS